MIALERLLGLALGELPSAEAAEVEQHVLECSPCAASLERLLALRDEVPALVRSGGMRFGGITAPLLERMERLGLITRTYRVEVGGSVACSVARDDLYTALHMQRVPLEGVARLDIDVVIPGRERRLTDVPFDAARGLVLMAQRADYIRTLPGGLHVLRLLAVEANGERELCHFDLNHTAYRE
jgi:hypothetical protein